MRRLYLTSVLIVCFCDILGAAAPTGAIVGSIQDPGGAVVPNAKVTATASATGLTRETHSGNDGQYVLPLLPVGVYSISVEAGGFERFEQTGIVVTADQNSMVPVALQVGSSTQSVTVAANAQMVETRSGALSQVINERNIIELPLNGRNPAALVLLTPGTLNLGASNAGGGSGGLQTVAYPGALLISSGGARYNGVNYYLDGGFNEDIYNSINNPFPNPDAVEEFSVVTNSYSAEYGGASGAIVNVVTKSGTNQFHGDGFDFLRNEDFNARNFFAATPDQLKRNQFGGSLGGPIKKDKLFFFANYQGTWSRDVTEANPATVPSAAERQGDFSAINAKLVNPYTGVAYANNQIPPSQFAPASVRTLQSIPLPQTPNGLVYYSLPVDSQENQFLTRADYNLSKHHIFGRYFYTHYVLDPVNGSQNLLQLAQGNNFLDQQATFSDTYTLSPNMINTAVFAYTRDNDVILAATAPFTWPGLGIPIAGSIQGQPEVNLSISGWFSVQTGHYTDNNRHTFDFSDILHWMNGSHEIVLGGEFVRMNDMERNIVNQNGTFSFSGTSLTGNPISDFVTGDVFQFVQGGGEYFNRSGNLPSLFFEDKYRVNRSLVLDLGLRWDPFFAYSDSLHRTECFVPGQHSNLYPNSPMGYLFEGDPGCPAGGFQPSWKEFAPRVGFAYNLRGKSKTTVRGGWGMFYQPPYMNMYTRMADSAPFSPQYVLLSVPFMNPYQGMANPFPAQFAPFVPPSNSTFALPLGAAQSFQPNWKPAKVMSWNLTIEHQLANNLLMRAGYVASAGRFLSYVTDANAPLPSPTATKANETARRPYQQYGAVADNMSGANSIYNALQVSLEKRFSRGLSLTANYTWSKSIDMVTNTGGFALVTAIFDPYDLNAYRGVSDFNVPQNFVLNAYWQLPSPGRGLAKALLGGWATTGIWTWQSGFPLNIKSGGDYSYSLPTVANDQAQLVSPWQYTTGSRGQRIQEWFTINSFTHPAPNTFGNVGRNTLIGPGTFNIDFAIHRTFSMSERFTLQYRAEFFDFLNHPELNNPNTTLNANTFGQITTARDPRIIQMALKLIF
ncbi:MAG TPA: carboxypeptidase regulatory-like domain-containing protein [Bryobacteraceae bacterium]|nr:carboxypeptidase regulatory-like domain-containing protein [Bryobacteraceae bacterium]